MSEFDVSNFTGKDIVLKNVIFFPNMISFNIRDAAYLQVQLIQLFIMIILHFIISMSVTDSQIHSSVFH